VFELGLTREEIRSFDIAMLTGSARLPASIEAMPGVGRLRVGRHDFLVNHRGLNGSLLALQFGPGKLDNPKVLGDQKMLVELMGNPDDSLWVIYSKDNKVCPPQVATPSQSSAFCSVAPRSSDCEPLPSRYGPSRYGRSSNGKARAAT
jgi:hypothetical protein